jgi:predicted transcriptional regulator
MLLAGGTRGRVPSDGSQKYQVKNIWDTHKEIMRLALMGMKHTEIAKQLNVSAAMVTYTLNSSIVKRQLDVMRGARDKEALDVAVEIKNLLPLAIRRLEEILEDDNTERKLMASVAQDLLDRGGHPAVRGVQGQFVSTVLTKDELEEIKERAKARGLLAAPSEIIELAKEDSCEDTYSRQDSSL